VKAVIALGRVLKRRLDELDQLVISSKDVREVLYLARIRRQVRRLIRIFVTDDVTK
jgi:hypothetical protein